MAETTIRKPKHAVTTSWWVPHRSCTCGAVWVGGYDTCPRNDRAATPTVGIVDTTPDMGDREELVDVLDTHMRLDDREDAERVADALIGHPGLLHRLSARSVTGLAPAVSEDAVAAVRAAFRSTVWPADVNALLDHLARVAVAVVSSS